MNDWLYRELNGNIFLYLSEFQAKRLFYYQGLQDIHEIKPLPHKHFDFHFAIRYLNMMKKELEQQ